MKSNILEIDKCKDLVLIAEDNLDLAEMLKYSIESLGKFECLIAHTGRAASEILMKENIALVITDISMPGGGGERVLAEAAVKGILSYVLSAQSNLEYLKKIGAEMVFRKPFETGALFEAIKDL